MQKIKKLIIDIDGVLWEGERVIPGASEAIDFLNKKKIPFLLVTNVTRMSQQGLSNKLKEKGFNVAIEHLIMPVQGCIEYVKGKKRNPKIFLIGSSTVEEELKNSQIIVTRKEEKVDFVVIAFDKQVNFEKMDLAFRLVKEGRAELIGLHENRFDPLDGKIVLSVGPIVKAVEYAAETKATILGKPNPCFYKRALAKLKAKPEETAMIGDGYESDIKGALDLGLIGILVKTGKFRLEYNEKKTTKKPQYIIESIAGLPKILSEK